MIEYIIFGVLYAILLIAIILIILAICKMYYLLNATFGGIITLEKKIDEALKHDKDFNTFCEKVNDAFFNENMINKGDIAFVGVISKVNIDKNYKFLFSDLDGTLIETLSGQTFPKDENDWKLKKDVIDAINNFNPEALYIISNQGGIEKGYFTNESFENKMINIINSLKKCLPNIKDIQYEYCNSNDKNSLFRKPNTGMIDRIVETYNIDINNCMMIGDASGKEGQFSDSDKKCAENAGLFYMDVNDFVNEYNKKAANYGNS